MAYDSLSSCLMDKTEKSRMGMILSQMEVAHWRPIFGFWLGSQFLGDSLGFEQLKTARAFVVVCIHFGLVSWVDNLWMAEWICRSCGEEIMFQALLAWSFMLTWTSSKDVNIPVNFEPYCRP